MKKGSIAMKIPRQSRGLPTRSLRNQKHSATQEFTSSVQPIISINSKLNSLPVSHARVTTQNGNANFGAGQIASRMQEKLFNYSFSFYGPVA